MAVRSRLLLPDIAVHTASGEMEVVSRQALLEAMADAVILQEMAGGFISLAVQRVPTGAPNEMVTVSAMIEWKDRTDAKAQPEPRAQPALSELAEEQDAAREAGRVPVPPPPPTPEELAEGYAELERMERIDVQEAIAAQAQAERPVLPFEHESPDGLDESTLEEEDVSAIPEHAR